MKSDQNTNMDDRLDEIESFRGIAALLVVLFHVPKWNGLLLIPGVQNFYLMVDVFFVLSGFVIYRAYGHRLKTREDLARFQFLRFGRLYPVHLLFLVLFAILELARLVAVTLRPAMDVASVPFSQNTPADLLLNLFLAQALVPGDRLTFNGVSWSISVEFYTYLLFGLVVLAARRAALPVFAVVGALAIAALSTANTFGLEHLLRCFAGFFVGCLTSAAQSRYAQRGFFRFPPFLATLGLAAFLMIKAAGAGDGWIYLLTAILLLALVNGRDTWTGHLLRTRVLVRLGTLSYAIYMSHPFLITSFEMVLNRLLKRPASTTPDGGYIAQLTTPEAIVAYCIFFSLLLLISTVVYERLEKPLRELSRKLASTTSRGSTTGRTSAS